MKPQMNEISLLQQTLKQACRHACLHAKGRLEGDSVKPLTEDYQIRDFGGGLKPNWARQKGFPLTQKFSSGLARRVVKSRGFDLESTQFQESERLIKMISLLTLALCWAHRVGVWLDEHRPLLVKKHGRQAQSFFRYGLDFMRSIFFEHKSKKADFHEVLKFLSCT